MDLTNPKRAGRNPDGVVYYKVLNGRRRPKMPAFKGELTDQQIWSVVTYAQSLRKSRPDFMPGVLRLEAGPTDTGGSPRRASSRQRQRRSRQ